MTLPQLAGQRFVTDGGMETDLMFHHGVDLPEFAAYPLVASEDGRAMLSRYYDGYAAVAAAAGTGLLLESPTWRANRDWGARLGDDEAALAVANRSAIEFLATLRDHYTSPAEVAGVRQPRPVTGPVQVVGMIGPRGDGYRAGAAIDPDEAADYHRPQIEAFAASGADLVTAYTLSQVGEAVGIVAAARSADIPVATSFTVEVDGRLPDGTPLSTAIEAVDSAGGPDYFLVNCARPRHVSRALDDPGAWVHRIRGLRVNASTLSHAELDEATELDDGDVVSLAREVTELLGSFPEATVLGGCCGTDSRHVAAMWGVVALA